MKFVVTTDRVNLYKKGEEVETSDDQLNPMNKKMMNMVRSGEAKLAWIKKVVKKVVKKSKK